MKLFVVSLLMHPQSNVFALKPAMENRKKQLKSENAHRYVIDDFFLIFDAQTNTHTQSKYSQFLMQTLGYSADKGGAPKTFKVL